MNFKCNDCKLEFFVDELTGRYTINAEKQVCCPICQSTVKLNTKNPKQTKEDKNG